MSQFLIDAEAEYQRARQKHSGMRSCHEGLAIIWEEFEELKAEVFLKHPSAVHMREELVQIAAMCNAFATELLPGGL